jgi:hypothetical protein
MKNIITKQFISNVFIAAIISVIVNDILLAIVKPIANAPETFSPFQYDAVSELTFLGVLAAGFVYIVIIRFYPVAYKKIFIWISVIALLLSFIPDIMLPYSPDADNQGATTFIVIILMIMHALTAGIVIWLFTRKEHHHIN